MRVRNTIVIIALVAGVLSTGGSVPAAAVQPDGMGFLRSTLATGGEGSTVAIADVTGDGRQDLIVANRASTDAALAYKVLVYAQGPDGTLATPTVYTPSPAPMTSASRMFLATGDLDGDTDLDLVVGNRAGFDVFYQSGGAFGAPVPISAPYPVHDVHVVDANGDGRQDVLYSIEDPTYGYRYLRRTQKLDHTIGGYAFAGTGAAETFTVGDVTGDGRPDLILEGASTSGTIFVHSEVDQTFSAVTDARIDQAVSAVVTDVDGDTLNDLVFLTPSELYVMTGQLDGTLADPVGVGGSFSQGAALEMADVNGDAAVDAIVFGPDGTHTFLQDDAGSLAGLTCDARTVIPTPTGREETVAVGDLTGDAAVDAVGAERDPVVRRLTNRTAGADVAASVAVAASGPLEFGEATDITGTLTTPAGRCGAPGQVQLERTLPSGTPEIIATGDLTATTADGTSATFAFEDVPSEVGTVEYRVLWAGDTVHAAAASTPVDVSVTKRSSSILLKASDTDILVGATVTLTATLTGGDRPAGISFFKVVDGVRTLVGTAPVDGSDRAKLDVAPLVSTTYVATYTATPTAKGATSGTVVVKVAKKQSSLALSAPTAITFGHAATLSAKLTGGGTGTRKIAFWALKDGTRVLLGRVAADGKGHATFAAKPKRNTSYVATYGGNATWSPATSPKRTVKVRVLTTGKMVHFGHKDNGVAYYVCCRAYFAFQVAPNHAGFKVLVESQYLDGSTWSSFDGSSKTFTLRADSTQEIFIDVSGGEPYKFRVHACMAKHADHLGDCSSWVGYRFE